jgi:hypothetical protein
LTATLSGCVQTSCSSFKCSDLPDMPKAGEKVATEIEVLCQNKNCTQLNMWLNELYFFRQEYEVYKNYE